MVYTVTANPSIDCYVSVRRLYPGALHRADAQVLRPGGKGINVALMLKRLGVPVTALGFTAGQTGEMLEQMLEREQLSHRFIPLPQGQTRLNVKITAEEETELNGAGPVVDAAALSLLADALAPLHANDILVLSGSLPSGAPQDAYARLARAARGARVILDAAGAALTGALCTRPYLVKPNVDELSEYLGSTPTTPAEVAAGAARLLTAGAQNVLVSMGQAGALLHATAGTWLLGAPAGQAQSTVGAGDAMVAGFVHALTRGEALPQALAGAVAAGSAAAFCEWLPTEQQVSIVRARIDSPRFICYNN